jgi:hypothetical protein
MSFKERDNRSQELVASVYDELTQVLPVVVVALADVDPSSAEEALQLLQRRSAPDALRHDKAVRHLVPGFVACPTRPAWLPYEADGEASLSVYKASNPA